jgi:hypothetical protein
MDREILRQTWSEENRERLASSREAAQITKDLSYLIADNQSSSVTKRMELIYLYPLHKPQILQYISAASGRDLREFYSDISYDNDFQTALTSSARRLTASASREDDISNLWAIFKRISHFDRAEALRLAADIQARVSRNEITGPKAERFARYALDAAAKGADYVASLPDDYLVEIMESDQFEEAKKDAFVELLKRNNPYATELITKSAEQLIDEKIDYLVIRQIYAQKLLKGDFTGWAEGFSVGDDSAIKQVEFSISEACQIDIFDSNNPDFVNVLMSFNDDSFFRALEYILAAKLPLDQLLDQEALTRLTNLISNVHLIEETIRQLIYPEQYIHFLCQNRPELAQKLWETGIPAIKQFFEDTGDTFYGGTFTRSFAEGFYSLILKDLSKLDTLGSESTKADDKWKEVRSVLFWKMVLLEPQRGEDLINQYFSGGHKVQLNGCDELISSLSINFSEQDRNDLLKQPQVREFFKKLVARRMIAGRNHAIPIVRDLAQSAGTAKLADELEEDLTTLNYSLSEAYFVNYFLPELTEKNLDDVKAKLEQFREIQSQCSLKNTSKPIRFQFSSDEENRFWNESQVWVAALMEVSPKMLKKVVTRNMEHTHGYYKLQEVLSVYGRVAYITRSEKFLELFYTVSQGMAPAKLWDFIINNYKLEEIANMSDREMAGIKEYLNGVGNLNLGKFYQAHRSILSGTIPQDARALGITETGNKGTDQLRIQLYAMVEGLLTDANFRINPENHLQMEILREISRFEVSEWRKGKALETIVKRVAQAEAFRLLDTPDGYFQKEVHVQKNEIDDSEFEYSIESIAKFKDLQEDFLWATDDDNNPSELVSQSSDSLIGVISEQLGKIERAIQKNPELEIKTAQQVNLLHGQLAAIQDIDTLDALLQQAVTIKASFRRDKTVDRVLRRSVISRFILLNKHLKGNIREFGEAAPTYQSMGKVAEFSEHTIGQKFIKGHFSGRELSRTLVEAFDSKGITAELERYRSNTVYTGQQQIKFVPNRKIMGELSGYIADACWTSQNDVMANNQNMTPIIIVTNPDQKKNMRTGGAFLLLEASDRTTGDKVLVIRGNNPQETIISNLDPIEYVREVVVYAKEVAKNRGISKVAIPLDGKGQSATNRQSVFDSYVTLYGNNRIISLSGNISFNGYDLGDICVVVS